jgi:hypothetical protein
MSRQRIPAYPSVSQRSIRCLCQRFAYSTCGRRIDRLRRCTRSARCSLLALTEAHNLTCFVNLAVAHISLGVTPSAVPRQHVPPAASLAPVKKQASPPNRCPQSDTAFRSPKRQNLNRLHHTTAQSHYPLPSDGSFTSPTPFHRRSHRRASPSRRLRQLPRSLLPSTQLSPKGVVAPHPRPRGRPDPSSQFRTQRSAGHLARPCVDRDQRFPIPTAQKFNIQHSAFNCQISILNIKPRQDAYHGFIRTGLFESLQRRPRRDGCASQRLASRRIVSANPRGRREHRGDRQ